jgi:hypothetical protein
MRRWLWWPTVPTHAIAGGIALIAVAILGLLEMPRFTFFKDYAAIQAAPGEFLGLALIFTVANACFFYMHARGDFLRMRNSLRPILISFALLFLLFPTALALYRYHFKGAPAPDFAALISGGEDWINGRNLSATSVREWTRAFRVLLVGEAGLTAVLLFSGLWKAPPQDTLDFVGTKSRARPLIRAIFCGNADLTKDQIDRLKLLLQSLVDGANKLSLRELLPEDLEFAHSVSGAAQLLLARLNRPWTTVRALRQNKSDHPMWSAVTVILGG